LSYPIHTKNTEKIAKLMESCTILHNMAVSDRVMGDPGVRYCPFEGEESDVLEREMPTDYDKEDAEEEEETKEDDEVEERKEDDNNNEEDDNEEDDNEEEVEAREVVVRAAVIPVQVGMEREPPRANGREPRAVTTIRDFDRPLASTVSHRIEWAALKDNKEWSRLQEALMNAKGGGGR
jgi:hypothetical protein